MAATLANRLRGSMAMALSTRLAKASGIAVLNICGGGGGSSILRKMSASTLLSS